MIDAPSLMTFIRKDGFNMNRLEGVRYRRGCGFENRWGLKTLAGASPVPSAIGCKTSCNQSGVGV